MCINTDEYIIGSDSVRAFYSFLFIESMTYNILSSIYSHIYTVPPGFHDFKKQNQAFLVPTITKKKKLCKFLYGLTTKHQETSQTASIQEGSIHLDQWLSTRGRGEIGRWAQSLFKRKKTQTGHHLSAQGILLLFI